MAWRMLGGCVWGVRWTPFDDSHPHPNLPPSRGKGLFPSPPAFAGAGSNPLPRERGFGDERVALGEAGGGEAVQGDVGRSGGD